MNRVAYPAEAASNRSRLSDDEILKLRNMANLELHEAATGFYELPGRDLEISVSSEFAAGFLSLDVTLSSAFGSPARSSFPVLLAG